jgi:hypothetical protein
VAALLDMPAEEMPVEAATGVTPPTPSGPEAHPARIRDSAGTSPSAAVNRRRPVTAGRSEFFMAGLPDRIEALILTVEVI